MRIDLYQDEPPAGTSGKGWWYRVTDIDGTVLLHGWRKGSKSAVRSHVTTLKRRIYQLRSGAQKFNCTPVIPRGE